MMATVRQNVNATISINSLSKEFLYSLRLSPKEDKSYNSSSNCFVNFYATLHADLKKEGAERGAC